MECDGRGRQACTIAKINLQPTKKGNRNHQVELLKAKGLALGMIPSIPHKTLLFDLKTGNLLLFMIDGITEPRNQQGRMYEDIRQPKSVYV